MRYSFQPCIVGCVRTSVGEQSVPQKDSVPVSVRWRVGFQEMATVNLQFCLKSTLRLLCLSWEHSQASTPEPPSQELRAQAVHQVLRRLPGSSLTEFPPSGLSGFLPGLFLYCVSVFCCIGRKGGLADSICLQWWQMELKKNLKEKCFSCFRFSDLLCSR